MYSETVTWDIGEVSALSLHLLKLGWYSSITKKVHLLLLNYFWLFKLIMSCYFYTSMVYFVHSILMYLMYNVYTVPSSSIRMGFNNWRCYVRQRRSFSTQFTTSIYILHIIYHVNAIIHVTTFLLMIKKFECTLTLLRET